VAVPGTETTLQRTEATLQAGDPTRQAAEAILQWAEATRQAAGVDHQSAGLTRQAAGVDHQSDQRYTLLASRTGSPNSNDGRRSIRTQRVAPRAGGPKAQQRVAPFGPTVRGLA